MARASKDKEKQVIEATGKPVPAGKPESPEIEVRVVMRGVVRIKAADVAAARVKIQAAWEAGRGVWMDPATAKLELPR